MFHNGRDCVACQPLLFPTVNLFPLCIPSLSKQPGPERGVANGTSKIVGLANFSSSLEISATFTKSLAVSLLVHLFRSRNLEFFIQVLEVSDLLFNNSRAGLGQKIARVA